MVKQSNIFYKDEINLLFDIIFNSGFVFNRM
jgi:hypothetical protein